MGTGKMGKWGKWGQTPIFYGMIRHLNCWAVMRCQEAQELFSWGLLIM